MKYLGLVSFEQKPAWKSSSQRGQGRQNPGNMWRFSFINSHIAGVIKLPHIRRDQKIQTYDDFGRNLPFQNACSFWVGVIFHDPSCNRNLSKEVSSNIANNMRRSSLYMSFTSSSSNFGVDNFPFGDSKSPTCIEGNY